jgi:hypothetical protein
MMAITIFIVSLPSYWPALKRGLGNFDPARQSILADTGAFAAVEQSSLVPISGTAHAFGENRSFFASASRAGIAWRHAASTGATYRAWCLKSRHTKGAGSDRG